jgi:ribosomal-protein-serine acetyltransferase
MLIGIDEHTLLDPIAQKHAEGLYKAVEANRDHLRKFLPWVDSMQTIEDFRNYITTCEKLSLQKKEVSFVIVAEDNTLGRIGLHYINLQNRNAAIGYWLIRDAEGKGIITRACRKLIDMGFDELGLERIEIKAAVENIKSRAIPERLHFKEEGILRKAELVNGVFVDLMLYSTLKEDWRLHQPEP